MLGEAHEQVQVLGWSVVFDIFQHGPESHLIGEAAPVLTLLIVFRAAPDVMSLP